MVIRMVGPKCTRCIAQWSMFDREIMGKLAISYAHPFKVYKASGSAVRKTHICIYDSHISRSLSLIVKNCDIELHMAHHPFCWNWRLILSDHIQLRLYEAWAV
jgi:hypothetical protein